ncbi:MAG TPA: tryptophan-rich sensory protein [Caldilineaceae bacterium]|nr:tryptophan-rich sensory protein [Caldilineaceae bacterium]
MVKQDKQWGALAIALATPFVAAAVGGVATSSSSATWYRRLRKPDWNPPGWIFGPVWNTLYLMMGFASWLVWRRRDDKQGWFGIGGKSQRVEVDGALRLYGIHLVFNALWSVIFFGLRRVDWALAELLVLWSLILTTLARFYEIDKRAGWLLVPYQLWATFATVLNFTIWRMNRD